MSTQRNILCMQAPPGIHAGFISTRNFHGANTGNFRTSFGKTLLDLLVTLLVVVCCKE